MFTVLKVVQIKMEAFTKYTVGIFLYDKLRRKEFQTDRLEPSDVHNKSMEWVSILFARSS